MLCVVTKVFTGNGENFQRNQLIDASQFRNHQALIAQHYLRPATQDEIDSAVEEDEPAPKPIRTEPVRRSFFGKAKPKRTGKLKARIAHR